MLIFAKEFQFTSAPWPLWDCPIKFPVTCDLISWKKHGWSLELSYLSFQGQFRGRTEIAPDQREKYVQRLQQVQQQGHSTLLSMPPLSGGNHKQFSAQQQSPLLQQVLFLICSFQYFCCVFISKPHSTSHGKN